MARYRRFDVRISLDEKVRRLSSPPPCGKFLWYHLLSMPESTMVPGLSRVGKAALAEALGWDEKGFLEAFGELFAEGLAKADWEARVVWIPNVAKYDPPQNPNVVLGWAAHWDEIPECPLKTGAWHHLLQYFEAFTGPNDKETKENPWLKAFLKACPKPLGNPLPNPSAKPLAKPHTHARDRNQFPDTVSGDRKQEGESEGGRRGAVTPDRRLDSHLQAPASGASPRAAPVKQERFSPGSIPIPAELDTSEFRGAWTLRLKERAEKGSKGKLTTTAVEAQLRKLAKLAAVRGLGVAIACVERATEGGHQGIVFDDDFTGPKGGNGSLTVPPEAQPHRPRPHGLRAKPHRAEDGRWYCLPHDSGGMVYNRHNWPADAGPWPLIPANWLERWGPYPENDQDEEEPPRELQPKGQPGQRHDGDDVVTAHA